MTTREGQGNFPDWATLRAHTIDRFDGELPHPVTEQEIIDAYELHPDAVEKAIAQVATDLTAGNIRSGWGVLRHRADAIRNPPSNPTAKSGRDLERAEQRAEQRIRNELLHYDRWEEVDEELFGDRGTLRDHTSPDLRSRMRALWQEHRPTGERIEAEAEERAQRWIENNRRLAELHDQERQRLDELQTAATTGADL